MPFVHVYDSQLGTLGSLYGNIGLNATAQQNFHNQLSADANDRAWSAQNFQQQQAQDSGDESAYRTLLNDITRRDIAQQANDTRTGIADANGVIRSGIADANNTSREAIATGNQGVRLTTNDNNNATRQRGQDLVNGLGYDKLAETQRNNDLKNGYGYDVIQKDYDVAQERIAAQQDAEKARTAEQAQRAQDRLDHAAQLAQIHEEIKLAAGEMQREQRAHDMAVRNYQPVDENAFQQKMNDLRGQIQTRIQAINGPPVTNLAPMMSGNMIPPAGAVAQPQANNLPPFQPGEGEMAQAAQQNPMNVVSQIGQQILSQMPGISKEAFRVELKLRLAQMGIDPASVGIQ